MTDPYVGQIVHHTVNPSLGPECTVYCRPAIVTYYSPGTSEWVELTVFEIGGSTSPAERVRRDVGPYDTVVAPPAWHHIPVPSA